MTDVRSTDLLQEKKYSISTNVKVSPFLVSSSSSIRAGPFEQLDWITLLIMETREAFRSMAFEASTRAWLVE